MRFLIAGLGSIGRRHLRNLLALGEEDIILYRTHRSLLPADEIISERKINQLPVETNLEAALSHQPDAVIVANPTALHLSVAIPVVKAGCHLLIEKPISHSLDGVRELQSAVWSSGSQVLVGFQFRFHPGLQQVARLLAIGAIGRPLSVRVHWGEYLPGWHPGEDYRQGYSARAELGGGVILTLSHPLDYLRWLLGDVSSLWAFAAHLSELQIDVEDTAEMGLQFESGVIGSVHLDYNQRPAEHSLEIVGSQGTLRWDNTSGVARLFRVSSETVITEQCPLLPANGALAWEEFPPMTGFQRNDMFLAEMSCFVERCNKPLECSLPATISSLAASYIASDAIRPEPVESPLIAPQPSTLEDGIQALNLALSALHSAKTGQRVDFNG